MARLLYIEASPRKKRSSSIEVAKSFLQEYENTHSDDEIQKIDLWQGELPPFNGDVIDSKYAIMHQQAHTEAQRKAWHAIEEIIDQFKTADKYLFSIPMWNFSIPYKLKHYIDLIVQPGYLFTVSPEGSYKGLVTGKSAALVYSRGGSYGEGSGSESYDIQKKYMEIILQFIGFDKGNIHSILIEPTEGQSTEEKERMLNKAKEKARVLASHF